jgi:hypothetical protein
MDGGKLLASRPGHFTPRERAPGTCYVGASDRLVSSHLRQWPCASSVQSSATGFSSSPKHLGPKGAAPAVWNNEGARLRSMKVGGGGGGG